MTPFAKFKWCMDQYNCSKDTHNMLTNNVNQAARDVNYVITALDIELLMRDTDVSA